MTEETKFYATTDFYVTAMLIATKHSVEEMSAEGNGGKTKRFHFVDSPELRKTIMKYMNGTLEGNLRDFRNAIEVTKDMCHQ